MIMKDFFKRNKFTFVAILLFLVFVFFLVEVKNIFFPNIGKAIYGNRLDGIEDVEITTSKKNEIKKYLEEDGGVQKAEVHLSGKIIEVEIIVNDDIAIDTAKGIGSKTLEKLSDEEKKFYDVQIFVNKNIEAGDFPIIGYRHHAKDAISWTKDRAAD